MMAENAIRLTWLGHSAFRFKSVNGRTLLIDPWTETSPVCPDAEKQAGSVDAIFITHGHFDHIGDAVAIAHAAKPAAVVAAFETTLWLGEKGVENCVGMNKGGTVEVLPGIFATMVYADHSGGIQDGGQVIYGGDPCGYVIQFENGLRVYHAGDTNVFGDMKLIRELYRPDVALLPIGGLFTMGPREAALAIRLLGVKRVVPMHYGTFPVLTGTPAALRDATADVAGLQVIELKPGESTNL
jgi:L-ascorbate metabolism protein UlaG (beta-lactamase superfamily)